MPDPLSEMTKTNATQADDAMTTPFHHDANVDDSSAVAATAPSSDRRKRKASVVGTSKGGASAGSKARIELPESLRASEEAVAVWAAAKLAGFDCRAQSVHGWQITWRPRNTGGKGKAGDMYIFAPRDSFSAGIGSVRSLANLRDALLSRKAAHDDPSSVLFHPPGPGCLVEVLLARAAGPDANGGSEEEAEYRQAQVLQVAPDRSFQVAMRNERCVGRLGLRASHDAPPARTPDRVPPFAPACHLLTACHLPTACHLLPPTRRLKTC